jgi:uncharacterized protein GlcG (DUF336 family)
MPYPDDAGDGTSDNALPFRPFMRSNINRNRDFTVPVDGSMIDCFNQETAMTALPLEKAIAIIDAAFTRGADLKLKPLGVSVLDAGGHLVAFQRQDGASFLRPQMSAGKAYGALAIGMGSRRVEAFAKERPHLVAGISDVSGGRVLPVVGGVLIRDKAGTVIGAVGISGDTSDNDEAAAIAGIEAAGFTADPG